MIRDLMSRTMTSEAGCIAVALALVFAPVAIAWALGVNGFTIAGTESDLQGGIK